MKPFPLDRVPRPILNALKEAGFSREGNFVFSSSKLYAIVSEQNPTLPNGLSAFREGERRWTVEFAYIPSFDKWSNSRHFQTEVWYSPKPRWTIPDMSLTAKWCVMVSESGLFNFQRYWATVTTPWFIHAKLIDYKNDGWFGKKK